MIPWPQKAYDIVDSGRDSRASIVTGLLEVATLAYLWDSFPKSLTSGGVGWAGPEADLQCQSLPSEHVVGYGDGGAGQWHVEDRQCTPLEDWNYHRP